MNKQETAMSNETDLDWLARNVHVWPTKTEKCMQITPKGWVWAERIEPEIGREVILAKYEGGFYTTEITEQQWLSRREELQNKPSWKESPEWAEWLAQDGDGGWWFYRSEPTLTSPVWSGVDRYFSKSGDTIGDWRDTIEKRPKEFKPSIKEANRLAQEFKPFTSVEDNHGQEMKHDNGWFERGELPPVGVECIFEPGSGACYFNDYELKASGKSVKVIAHTRYQHSSCDVAVFRWDLDGCFGVSTGNTRSFIPIRTEREAAIEDMVSVMSATKRANFDINAAALYDAGYRKESK